MKAVVFEAVGEAREVLSLHERPAPTPGAEQVLIAVEASPVHPADFGFVRGAYRVKPTFPQVAGLSGAGRIVSVGAGVSVRPGTRVAFRWPGAWAEQVAVPEARTFAVPEDIASDAAAQFPVNPVTAWGLLETAQVQPGAWLGLTAPASSVAVLVAALAHARGIRVVGIGRQASLATLGPEVRPVSEGEPEPAQRVRDITGGEGLSALLDCVGGPLVTSLFPALRQGATIVAYGTLSPEPVLVRNASLVYSNLSWLGFGIDRWSESLTPERTAHMTAALWDGIRRGQLPLPISERFRLADFSAALALAAAGGPGKVILANT
jgi:NADPH:quinone reductase-like Zn-dependent oxidoreductase